MKFNPNSMKIKICKNCKGLGVRYDITGQRFICDECGGTGRILEENIVSEFPLNMLDDLHSEPEQEV